MESIKEALYHLAYESPDLVIAIEKELQGLPDEKKVEVATAFIKLFGISLSNLFYKADCRVVECESWGDSFDYEDDEEDPEYLDKIDMLEEVWKRG